ncbi:MAG: hypothetical protein AMXMBFR7_35210 [Planctomycetota bacterium]
MWGATRYLSAVSKKKADPKAETVALVPAERIERAILLIRGHKVMLDSDLAELYGVSTGAFNRAVKRNIKRFPADFMFVLTQEEFDNLKCQFGTSSSWGGRRKIPQVFTEHGAIMAASVLNSQRAIDVSVFVVRAFVRLRELLATHKDLARKLADMEQKYDKQFAVVFQAIRELMETPEAPAKGKLGFQPRKGLPKP